MRQRSFIPFFVLLCFVLCLQYGCSKSGGGYGNNNNNNNNTVDCTGNNPSFSAAVLPLMQTKCAINSDCHASGSTNSGGPFTTYAHINAKSSNIKTQVSSGAMPKTGTLTTSEKNTILCWVNNGAANN